MFAIENVNKLCKKAGFYIHSPYEIPLKVPYEKFVKLIYGALMEVSIKPEVITSDEDIREMNPHHRKCYFEDEFQLKYFKHYTKSHCDMEVLSEITYENCGCVPFNYIRNKSMNICDLSRWPCAIAQTRVVLDGKANTKFSRHCLPLCNSISYNMEVVSSRVASNHSEK